jgi:hypothetical protein
VRNSARWGPYVVGTDKQGEARIDRSHAWPGRAHRDRWVADPRIPMIASSDELSRPATTLTLTSLDEESQALSL